MKKFILGLGLIFIMCSTAIAGTGSIILPVQGAKLTGVFVTHTPAGCSTTASTAGIKIDAGDGNWRGLYDETVDTAAIYQFRMPADYSSAPIVKIGYSMTSATTGTVEFEASVMCITDGDAADVGTASFADCVVATETVPGTAGHPSELSITVTDDSCAAGDTVFIWVSTDADDGTNDTATGDRENVHLMMTYTN